MSCSMTPDMFSSTSPLALDMQRIILESKLELECREQHALIMHELQHFHRCSTSIIERHEDDLEVDPTGVIDTLILTNPSGQLSFTTRMLLGHEELLESSGQGCPADALAWVAEHHLMDIPTRGQPTVAVDDACLGERFQVGRDPSFTSLQDSEGKVYAFLNRLLDEIEAHNANADHKARLAPAQQLEHALQALSCVKKCQAGVPEKRLIRVFLYGLPLLVDRDSPSLAKLLECAVTVFQLGASLY
ncbi:hypothetical protein WJX72_005568 [[Myrmecia] bisecta]|uniref:Uncharacterized protein n=1 Tax=[Myrmecia] bisecta TaxID=41462 RepID=A0AAW1PDL0_9CHLO